MHLPPLALISLGNPAPYTNTLHSAGHIAIQSLRHHLAQLWSRRKGALQPNGHREARIRKREFLINARAKNQRCVPSDAHTLSIFPDLSDLDPDSSADSESDVASPSSLNPEPGPGVISPQPPFHLWRTRTTPAHFISQSPRFRLHQSPTLMNASGRFVHRIYHESVRQLNEQFQKPALRHLILPCPLVVLHDDLELPLGVVKERPWDSSAKGHNGMKSVHSVLKKPTEHLWFRVAIGIGRPEERTSEAVVEWVLRELHQHEKKKLQGVAPDLLAVLEGIEQRVRKRMAGLQGVSLEELEVEENQGTK